MLQAVAGADQRFLPRPRHRPRRCPYHASPLEVNEKRDAYHVLARERTEPPSCSPWKECQQHYFSSYRVEPNKCDHENQAQNKKDSCRRVQDFSCDEI
jgi:hypothetical protein